MPYQYRAFEPKATSSYRPFQIIKDVAYGCKVLFIAFVVVSLVWIFAFGQPQFLLNLPAGIYQGFKCGWTSEVVNPWTCDKS